MRIGVRPYSHSFSDDERNYKTKHEREEDAHRDPLLVLSKFLVEENVLDKPELERIKREIDHQVLEAAHTALKAEPTAPESALANLYSETADPTSSQFDVVAQPEGEPKLMSDLINATLKEEMRRNDRIVVFARMLPTAVAKEIFPRSKAKAASSS